MEIMRPYTQINLDTWKRRQHFEQFGRGDYPYIGVTTDVDITSLLPACREHGARFFTAFLYVTMRAMNAVENFRYRLFEDQIVLCDLIDPSFNTFNPEDELFYFSYSVYNPNYLIFAIDVEQAKQAAIKDKRLASDNRVDVVYVSCLPWFRFSDIIQPMGLAANDTIPRIVWGKYETQDNGRTTIPFSITGHHGLFDGHHIAQLLSGMEALINNPYFLKGPTTRSLRRAEAQKKG